MKKIFRPSALAVLGASLAVPLLAAAQTGININAITPYSEGIKGVINNILVPVLIAIAFIVFLWGVYKYFILGADNETERETGKQFTLWGIIGFVVILSLWGIVNLVMSTFGLSVGSPPPFPTIGGSISVPGGSQGQIRAGSGPVSAQQNAAISSLNQQYTNASNICAQYGNQSNECQSAAYAYSQATQAYSATYLPSSGGSAATADQTYQSCIDNGGDPAVCQCEASGGAWSLTDNQCSTTSTYEPPATSPAPQSAAETPSVFQACIDNGGDSETCQCEANGGAMGTDGACSVP